MMGAHADADAVARRHSAFAVAIVPFHRSTVTDSADPLGGDRPAPMPVQVQCRAAAPAPAPAPTRRALDHARPRPRTRRCRGHACQSASLCAVSLLWLASGSNRHAHAHAHAHARSPPRRRRRQGLGKGSRPPGLQDGRTPAALRFRCTACSFSFLFFSAMISRGFRRRSRAHGTELELEWRIVKSKAGGGFPWFAWRNRVKRRKKNRGKLSPSVLPHGATPLLSGRPEAEEGVHTSPSRVSLGRRPTHSARLVLTGRGTSPGSVISQLRWWGAGATEPGLGHGAEGGKRTLMHG